MARLISRQTQITSTPVWPGNRGGTWATYSLGTTAVPIPTTNLSYRKGLLVQNQHASQDVYLGWCVPEVYGKKPRNWDNESFTLKSGQWFKSGTGNEWFFALSDKTTAGLTQPTAVYYNLITDSTFTETSATIGTAGSIAAEHGVAWGDNDTLGYSTLYIRTNGSLPGNKPEARYNHIIGYFSLPSSSTGYKVAAGASVYMDMDGGVRVFAAASGASTTTFVGELI